MPLQQLWSFKEGTRIVLQQLQRNRTFWVWATTERPDHFYGRPKEARTSQPCVKGESVSISRRRHQMETFSALLVLCEGNLPVTGEFPSQRPVTRSFEVFFDLRLNTRLSKQSRRRWFEMPSRSLWRHYHVMTLSCPGESVQWRGCGFVGASCEQLNREHSND